MKRVLDHIRDHMLSGMESHPVINLKDLRKSEWSIEFENLMRNRLIFGAYRYGRLAAPGKPQFDRCEYIERKVAQYRETGNTECLVDIANLALVEFVEGNHPQKHFASLDDHNQHARRVE